MSILLGTKLGHYEIRSQIGAGGMGEVYLAQDTKLDRKVALKILPVEVAAHPDRMKRFVQEAKTASALNHPNIITIYEIDETDSGHFIATEFIDGETLRQHMRKAPLKLGDVLDVAAQIASALSAAHAAGIVHRDIKPENVMLRRDGIVKVLDFGLAKLTERLPPESVDAEAATKALVQTEPGVVLGTAAYMSPEQARGTDTDARTDIFSLGVVLYEMLAGRAPFTGETTADIISMLLQKEPQPLSTLAHDVPAELQHIVSKALRKDRDERYQRVKSLLVDLKTLQQELDFAAKLERGTAPDSKDAAARNGAQAANANAAMGNAQTQTATARPTSSAEYVVSHIKQHRRGFAAGLAVLLLVVIGFGYWLYNYRASKPAQIESIAVMPFVNESGNADVEYLSDGMTETLISTLSQLPNLSVKARSSVFRYKGKQTSPQTIGKDLNVQAILNGRVTQRGDQLTLTLELVDAQTENVIWSEQYNRKQTDLVSLQSEIAHDVSSKLKTRLSGADEAKLAKTYTTNPEAYQLYLKGRFNWNRRTTESLKQAAEFYKQAIEKDPNYALAYSGLAETYALFSSYSVASSKDSMPQAKAAALRALELDDSLAEPHAVLGIYLTQYEWDRVGGEKEYRRAIELNPNYATAHQWFAFEVLTPTKRFDEALTELRRAEELDPLSPIIGTNLGDTLVNARRYDEAVAQYKRVLSLDPNFAYARQALGWAYGSKGMYPEAITETRKSFELNHDPQAQGYLGLWLARSGGRDEAMKLLDQLKQESTQHYVPGYSFALIYIGLNEKEEALNWIEKEISDRSPDTVNYGISPELDDLRSNPRFKEMLKRLNLPE